MKIKPISFMIAILIVTLFQFCQVLANNAGDGLPTDSALKIYLPREIAIEDNLLKLSLVSIIMGEESLAAKVGEITLGHFSMPGQKITMDRATVLSRLACNGIRPSQISLIGAEKITIKKQHKVIKSSEFVKLADSFLKKSTPAGSFCQAEPIRIPKDLLLPMMDKDVMFSPRMVESSTANQAKVRISVLADSNEIGVGEVTFRLKFNCRTAVTLTEIPAGEVISPENVKLEKIVTDYPEAENWSPPYGLITRRTLPANTVIQPGMVGSTKPAVSIKRNETVVIKIEIPGLLVTALGKAMQQGLVGESIKVRNIDSQRIILAKVNEDGTVEPTF